MKITSFIIRTLCAGTVGSLACQAAMQAYADDVPSTFVEGNYSPEVARYVQSIAGVALASGIHDYDENATSSYQVLAQVLNSGNVTELPEDLKRAIGMLTGYVPDPNEIIQPIMSRKQIERMRKMADRIKNLMEEKIRSGPGRLHEHHEAHSGPVHPGHPPLLRHGRHPAACHHRFPPQAGQGSE